MSETSQNFPKTPASSVVSSSDHTRLAEKIPTPLTLEKFIEQAITDYESPLIGYANTLLNDLDRARDVVQDTFIRLCQQDRTKVEVHLKSWLFTVCRNRALDILRKEKRSQPLEEELAKKVVNPGLQPDQVALHRERAALLTRYLARLTPNQREVIILKFQQGMSYQDIQEITGLASGNIGFLIHTGLKRLREILPQDLRL